MLIFSVITKPPFIVCGVCVLCTCTPVHVYKTYFNKLKKSYKAY